MAGFVIATIGTVALVTYYITDALFSKNRGRGGKENKKDNAVENLLADIDFGPDNICEVLKKLYEIARKNRNFALTNKIKGHAKGVGCVNWRKRDEHY